MHSRTIKVLLFVAVLALSFGDANGVEDLTGMGDPDRALFDQVLEKCPECKEKLVEGDGRPLFKCLQDCGRKTQASDGGATTN